MDFFDQTFSKAKEVFDVAKKKTTDAVSLGKQKYDIAAMENRRNKSYEALGVLAFDLFKEDENASDEVKALVNQIKNETEEIEDAKREVIKMKNKRICPNCQNTVEENSAFCNHCGEKLIYTEEQE